MFEFQPQTSENEETQEVTFPLSLFDDSVAEGNEVFTVSLFTSDSNVLFSVSEVEVTIVDDDGKSIKMTFDLYCFW